MICPFCKKKPLKQVSTTLKKSCGDEICKQKMIKFTHEQNTKKQREIHKKIIKENKAKIPICPFCKKRALKKISEKWHGFNLTCGNSKCRSKSAKEKREKNREKLKIKQKSLFVDQKDDFSLNLPNGFKNLYHSDTNPKV